MRRTNGFGLRHIEHVHSATTLGLQCVECGGIDIGGNDLRTLTHKGKCGGTANALSSGGDEGGFSC
jgi:hypothetical protein